MEDLLNELLELERAGWRSLCDGTAGDFYGNLMTENSRMVLANGVVMGTSVSVRDDSGWKLAHYQQTARAQAG